MTENWGRGNPAQDTSHGVYGLISNGLSLKSNGLEYNGWVCIMRYGNSLGYAREMRAEIRILACCRSSWRVKLNLTSITGFIIAWSSPENQKLLILLILQAFNTLHLSTSSSIVASFAPTPHFQLSRIVSSPLRPTSFKLPSQSNFCCSSSRASSGV